MKKYTILLVVLLAVFMLASCATKAQANETAAEPEVAQPAAEQQPAAESEEITLNFPYAMKAYPEEGKTGEFLDLVVAYDPDRTLVWNPWYQNQEGQSYLEFVEVLVGDYKDFEGGPRPAQLFTFHALQPVDAVVFGLDLKDQSGKILSEIAIAVGIDQNLGITILDHKTRQPED